MKAMRVNAPLRLKKLLTKHQLKDGSGNAVPECYKGADMWTELKTLRTQVVSEYWATRYAKATEKLRDTVTPDNVSPQDWAKRLNTFIAHINPYLEVPYAGARLGRFIVKTLPDELASDGRTLLRELEKSGEIADEQIVISSVQKLIEQAVRSLLGASYHTHTHTHTLLPDALPHHQDKIPAPP